MFNALFNPFTTSIEYSMSKPTISATQLTSMTTISEKRPLPIVRPIEYVEDSYTTKPTEFENIPMMVSAADPLLVDSSKEPTSASESTTTEKFTSTMETVTISVTKSSEISSARYGEVLFFESKKFKVKCSKIQQDFFRNLWQLCTRQQE